jgi:hypothetical protein
MLAAYVNSRAVYDELEPPVVRSQPRIATHRVFSLASPPTACSIFTKTEDQRSSEAIIISHQEKQSTVASNCELRNRIRIGNLNSVTRWIDVYIQLRGWA